MRSLLKAKELSEELYSPWAMISKGEQLVKQKSTVQGKDLIWKGNLLIFRHEQEQVLAISFRTLAQAGVSGMISSKVKSPLPPTVACPTFSQQFPKGNYLNFNDRWQYLSKSVWKQWKSYSEDYPKKAQANLGLIVKWGQKPMGTEWRWEAGYPTWLKYAPK